MQNSLGLIETKGLIGIIEAADAAAKAAAVVIATAELTPGALMTIKIEGELSAVRAAVDAGARAAERVGELVAAHVIPRPSDDLGPMLPPRRYISKYHPDDDRPSLGPDEPLPKPKPRAPRDGAPTAAARPLRRAPAKESVDERTKVPAAKPPPTESADSLKQPTPGSPTIAPAGKPTLADLEKMPVVKLRRYARTIANLPIRGREISMANKGQLLEAIKSIWDRL